MATTVPGKAGLLSLQLRRGGSSAGSWFLQAPATPPPLQRVFAAATPDGCCCHNRHQRAIHGAQAVRIKRCLQAQVEPPSVAQPPSHSTWGPKSGGARGGRWAGVSAMSQRMHIWLGHDNEGSATTFLCTRVGARSGEKPGSRSRHSLQGHGASRTGLELRLSSCS